MGTKTMRDIENYKFEVSPLVGKSDDIDNDIYLENQYVPYISCTNNIGCSIVTSIAIVLVLWELYLFIQYQVIHSQIIEVVVWNEYGLLTRFNEHYKFMENSVFIEAGKNNTIVVPSPNENCLYGYTFKISTHSSYSYRGYTNPGINWFYFHPTITGKYTLSLEEICDSKVKRAYSQTVWVKYVRREFKSLTESDKTVFFNTFVKGWKIDTRKGKRLYGDSYKSIQYFATVYNDARANTVCDEFSGSGYVNNHMMLVAYLEQALQKINPSFRMPYINFTSYFDSSAFDQHITDELDYGTWTYLMTEDYFGSSDPYSGRILNSIWRNMTVPLMSSSFYSREGISQYTSFFPYDNMPSPHLSSPYGFLRPPWNYNPWPYLSRFNNVNRVQNINSARGYLNEYFGISYPTIADIISSYNGDSLTDLLLMIESLSNENVLTTIGGCGGDFAAETYSYLTATYGFNDDTITLLSRFGRFVKNQFTTSKFSILNCTSISSSSFTSLSYPKSTNGPICTCDLSLYTTNDDINTLLVDTIFDIDKEFSAMKTILELSYESKVDVITSMCNGFLIDGDIGTTIAPMDPIFWLSLGILEVIYQSILTADLIVDRDYPTVTGCSGYSSEGKKSWLNGFSLESQKDGSTLTNINIAHCLDPKNVEYGNCMSYVYDLDNL